MLFSITSHINIYSHLKIIDIAFKHIAYNGEADRCDNSELTHITEVTGGGNAGYVIQDERDTSIPPGTTREEATNTDIHNDVRGVDNTGDRTNATGDTTNATGETTDTTSDRTNTTSDTIDTTGYTTDATGDTTDATGDTTDTTSDTTDTTGDTTDTTGDTTYATGDTTYATGDTRSTTRDTRYDVTNIWKRLSEQFSRQYRHNRAGDNSNSRDTEDMDTTEQGNSGENADAELEKIQHEVMGSDELRKKWEQLPESFSGDQLRMQRLQFLQAHSDAINDRDLIDMAWDMEVFVGYPPRPKRQLTHLELIPSLRQIADNFKKYKREGIVEKRILKYESNTKLIDKVMRLMKEAARGDAKKLCNLLLRCYPPKRTINQPKSPQAWIKSSYDPHESQNKQWEKLCEAITANFCTGP